MPSVPTEKLGPGDAALVVAIAIALVMLIGPATARYGLVGVGIVQVVAFAAPPLVLAAMQGRPLLRLGVTRASGRALAGAALIGASLWLVQDATVRPILSRFFSTEELEELAATFASADPIVTIVVAVLAPALCEELLFRGALARSLEPRLGLAGAVAISAMVFGAAHLSPLRFVPASITGAALAYATLASGSLLPAMILHALNNLASLAAAGTFGLVFAPGPRAGPVLVVAAMGATGLGVWLLDRDRRTRRKSSK